MKKVAILQSNYIPWKGYFDIISAVDEFIIYDDMQFTKNDWRNRNKIKTPRGVEWLTVPVGQDIKRKIRDVTIQDSRWAHKHWRTLENNYKKSTYFSELAVILKPIYTEEIHTNLSELNCRLIKAICQYLGISTKIRKSWDYEFGEGKTERLVELCIKSGANIYISGPAAKDYLDEDLFGNAGISLTWFDYSGYPEYPQLWGGFVHGVTILDLLFNCGKKSRDYMKFVNK